MARRLVLLALVPTLLLAMVGGAVAALRPGLLPDGMAAAGQPTSSFQPTPVPTPSAPSPEPSSPSPSPSPSEPPPSKPSPEPSEPSPEPSEPEVDVERVQRVLARRHYYVGPVDGKQGPATTSAVVAFQKVNGLVADGIIGRKTLAALKDPARPSLDGGPDHRMEVDLDKQVLYYVEDGEIARIMPVSSGNGETYTTDSGGTAAALTPVGTFTVERRISGLREAPLGSLYDPLYFYRGWAIHGSNSVPAYPASHGCVRLSRADALWLFERAPVGTTVTLYGGTHTFRPGSDASASATPGG